MKIIADMHMHTVASTHGYSTIKEIAEHAAKIGLEYIAITDHTPLSTDAPHIWHFHNLHKAIPRELFGVKIVYGAESSVTDYAGHIDLPHNECAALDWIIGSVHMDLLKSGTIQQNTAAYLGLAENDDVDVIGHCASTGFLFDYETGIKAFREHDKLVEINESTLLWKNSESNYREIIPLCKKYGVTLIFNSDAHFYLSVGNVDNCIRLAEEFDYPKELIINADSNALYERLCRKNGRIFG